jgi:hypothetical protein
MTSLPIGEPRPFAPRARDGRGPRDPCLTVASIIRFQDRGIGSARASVAIGRRRSLSNLYRMEHHPGDGSGN